jgi:serine/threonine protein kinase
MYSEFVEGETLGEFLDTSFSAEDLRTVIFQVIYILKEIHRRYISFRHHDLHTGNIMVTRDGPGGKILVKIMDFGMSTMSDVPNYFVEKSPTFKTEYGIFKDSHRMYDVHLFLNALYGKLGISAKTSPALRFITTSMPMGYLQERSSRVQNHRLRYDLDHKDLPTYARLLKHPYFKSETMNRGTKTPRMKPSNVTPLNMRANRVRIVNRLSNAVAMKKK